MPQERWPGGVARRSAASHVPLLERSGVPARGVSRELGRRSGWEPECDLGFGDPMPGERTETHGQSPLGEMHKGPQGIHEPLYDHARSCIQEVTMGLEPMIGVLQDPTQADCWHSPHCRAP